MNKTKFPTKQANRNLKGALYKNVQIISADFFIGRSAMPTRTRGASPPGPPLIFIFTPHCKVLARAVYHNDRIGLSVLHSCAGSTVFLSSYVQLLLCERGTIWGCGASVLTTADLPRSRSGACILASSPAQYCLKTSASSRMTEICHCPSYRVTQ